MQIHEIRPKNKFKKKKRIGRGGKRGTYSGKGMKGQKARSGTGGTNITEKGRNSWIKRLPKLGGFASVYLENIIVKTTDLEKSFKAGAMIDPKVLIESGIVKRLKRGKSGKLQLIKILNSGPITKKLEISGCLVSKKVKEQIEKLGGSVKDIPQKKKVAEKKKFVPKKV